MTTKTYDKDHHRPFGGRSVQRLHLRGRQDLAPHQSGCRSQQLRAQHAAGPQCRATKLSFASSTPCIIATALATTRPGDTSRRSRAGWRGKSFEYGRWGGEFRTEFMPEPGEIVARNIGVPAVSPTRILHLQLNKHGIHQLIVAGLIAHTCVEATVRYAAELGYDVTVVKDATADYSDEMCMPRSISISQITPAQLSARRRLSLRSRHLSWAWSSSTPARGA